MGEPLGIQLPQTHVLFLMGCYVAGQKKYSESTNIYIDTQKI